MAKRKKWLRFVLPVGLWLSVLALQAQQPCESLLPLAGNPVLEEYGRIRAARGMERNTAKQQAISSVLPFFDDFSHAGPYPSARRWTGTQIYVNHHFPVYAPTYGVATFDGLDGNGNVYPHATPDVPFTADTLCSQPIRLDSVFSPLPAALKPSDSVYLSFFYQPGGGLGSAWDPTRRGTAPAPSDALTLEFFNPSDSTWTIVWNTAGMDMEAFCPFWDSAGYPVWKQNYFRQVMIPITDTAYFSSAFRFRFRNKSTISSSLMSAGGQWHVDYIYLNAGRSRQDTVVDDVAFTGVTPSVLREYSEVPYRHFRTEMLRDHLRLGLTNLGAKTLSCRYRCLFYDQDGNEVYAQPQSGEANVNIYPFVSDGYRTDPDLSQIPMTYPFGDVLAGPAVYTVRHIAKSDIQSDFSRQNDTLVFVQKFSHEFAYDDGTAESGWGLNYSGATFAYRFELPQADSLTAVRMFFNRSYGNQNRIPVNLTVWGEGAGDTIPGEVLYRQEGLEVAFSDGLNRFVNYRLSEPVLLPAGKFYIGLEQTSGVFLNMGFDQNAELEGRLLYSYYNTLEHRWEWLPSMYKGALMMRPAFGTAGAVANEEAVAEWISCKAFPNPVRDGSFRIELPQGIDPKTVRVGLHDMQGRCLWEKAYAPFFRTENPVSGLYLLRLTVNGKTAGYTKLVIVR